MGCNISEETIKKKMAINLTNLTSANNMYDMAVYANNSSNHILFGGLTIAFLVILTMALKRYPFPKGFLVASWTTFILSTILWAAKLIPIYYAITYLILAGVTGFMVWREEEK